MGTSKLTGRRTAGKNTEPRANPKPTKLNHIWFCVQVPRGATNPERPALVREALEAWYVDHARSRIPERVDLLAARTGLEPKSVIVRHQAKRWGCCDAHGNLDVNWRITQAPMRLVDWVVAHELAHLRAKDHTKAHWTLLGKIMLGYDERRELLRATGQTIIEW